MDGRGCGGYGGVSPTRVSYLRGAEAAEIGAPGIATVAVAGVVWLTARGPARGDAAAAGGGEEGHTRGL